MGPAKPWGQGGATPHPQAGRRMGGVPTLLGDFPAQSAQTHEALAAAERPDDSSVVCSCPISSHWRPQGSHFPSLSLSVVICKQGRLSSSRAERMQVKEGQLRRSA